jgi:hypothetical protein
VVLSNGTITYANPKNNVDLHKALKGGGNNFGIVTRFDVRTFPQGPIWSGWTSAAPGQHNIPNTWFEYFASSRNRDLGGMVVYYANYAQGNWVNEAFISYVHPQQNPHVFSGLLNASIFANAKVTTMQEVARQNTASSPSGTRSSFSTFTIINSARYIEALLDLGEQYANSIPSLSEMNLSFEPLWSNPRLRSFQYGGGNVLGLENEKRDLVIVQIHTVWPDAMQSYQVKSKLQEFINRAERLAQQMGAYHPYKYLNYAESFQDVMSSYSNESVEFMLRTSQKYDSIQLWQRRVPGGFKLPLRKAIVPTPTFVGSRVPTSVYSSSLNSARQTKSRTKPTLAPQRQEAPPEMPKSQPKPQYQTQTRPQPTTDPEPESESELEPQRPTRGNPSQQAGFYPPSGGYLQPYTPYTQSYSIQGYPPPQPYPYYYPGTPQPYYQAPEPYSGVIQLGF